MFISLKVSAELLLACVSLHEELHQGGNLILPSVLVRWKLFPPQLFGYARIEFGQIMWDLCVTVSLC